VGCCKQRFVQTRAWQSPAHPRLSKGDLYA
jgi:hypothetical protein